MGRESRRKRGSFTAPIGTIPDVSKVEVLPGNLTDTFIAISLPRGDARHDTVTVGARAEGVAGELAQSTAAVSVGMRWKRLRAGSVVQVKCLADL